MPESSLSPGNVLGAGRVGVFTYTNNQWKRTGTLFASKPTAGANFGRSIVLQNDTALIGSNATLYVFRRTNGTWRQIQQIKPPSSDGVTQYPQALAIYSDTAVVTASAGQEGLVYVYQLQTDGTLKWAARVRSPTADPSERFAASVDVDRGWLVVGATASSIFSPQTTGAAYLFHRVNGQWRYSQKLIPIDGAVGDQFGTSVAIDNYTVVVGAPLHDRQFNGEPATTGAGGAAYVFVANGGPFVQTAQLRPTASENQVYGRLGEQVAITSDRIITSAQMLDGQDYPHIGWKIFFTYVRYSALNEVLGEVYLYDGYGFAVDQKKLFAGDPDTDSVTGPAIGTVRIFDLVHRNP
jgi:hypothetical protein